MLEVQGVAWECVARDGTRGWRVACVHAKASGGQTWGHRPSTDSSVLPDAAGLSPSSSCTRLTPLVCRGLARPPIGGTLSGPWPLVGFPPRERRPVGHRTTGALLVPAPAPNAPNAMETRDHKPHRLGDGGCDHVIHLSAGSSSGPGLAPRRDPSNYFSRHLNPQSNLPYKYHLSSLVICGTQPVSASLAAHSPLRRRRRHRRRRAVFARQLSG